MSYQLSMSECCCASLYGKLYIKMLEASNDPILEFSAAGGYTFNFKERESERERDLVHIDADYTHQVPPMISELSVVRQREHAQCSSKNSL